MVYEKDICKVNYRYKVSNFCFNWELIHGYLRSLPRQMAKGFGIHKVHYYDDEMEEQQKTKS